jgi:CheY-like chemotaxis protein
MTKRNLTILHLEDNPADVFLVKRHLRMAFPDLEVTAVSNRSSFEEQVKQMKPDVVLSDYRLPEYSGIEALLFTRSVAPTMPFVFLTGAIEDEQVAETTILKGAHAFVLKNNLAKLTELVHSMFSEQQQLRHV